VPRDPDFESMVRLCARSGVPLVLMPEMPGTRASGAARWLSPAEGLIQLSLRHTRDDHFWFSFFHEAAHLLLHSKKATFVTNAGEQDQELEDEGQRVRGDAPDPETLRARAARPPHAA
jgi:hypothetical protein